MSAQNGAPPRRCAAITRGATACAMPPLRDGDWCFRHDPARATINLEHARAAARRSHQLGTVPALEWSESLRWGRPEDVMVSMRELATLLAKGALSATAAEGIRRAAETWLRAFEVDAKRKPAGETPAFHVLDVSPPPRDMGEPEIAAHKPATAQEDQA